MQRILKSLTVIALSSLFAINISGREQLNHKIEREVGGATLTITPVAKNAVRVQVSTDARFDLPDTWIYPNGCTETASDLAIDIDDNNRLAITYYDAAGNPVTVVDKHILTQNNLGDLNAYTALISLQSPDDEYITGLGQFQDGLGNLRGAIRRLTQVNTQISIPMMISNKGYGILWNNYGIVDFNPADHSIEMLPAGAEGNVEIVDVTSTEGGKQEMRRSNAFTAGINIDEAGDYAIMLDVGQSMARRHNIVIDGQTVVDVRNVWLPPTTSVIVNLATGNHTIESELTDGDKPVIYYRKIDDTTTLSSAVADKIDYTVFTGTPDEIIATYRRLTGDAPLMPQWALGYVQCRERYHSSDEILENARTFREHQIPIDVIVQDWQWWGKHGWNAMTFDEDNYPDPSALTNELHDSLNVRLMLSVWSKIDDNSPLGRSFKDKGYYIPGTTWVDFFNPEAANEYWRNFSDRLLVHNIDAWWQDATEPENDDLVGRRVAAGTLAGEQVRNVYPLLVSETVYNGLREDDSHRRPMILTRSGFPGIHRYGSTLWSGDVGNDWETLRRQITGGLGLMSAGHPWWTYDAGGFFRPGNQYTDPEYIERMLRWVECATFLPLMRVHGYISDTEPWRYGPEAENIIRDQINLRYRLLPYIYTCAARVSDQGSTLMRPLVFDFATDTVALKHNTQYMFGPSLLVNPVLSPAVDKYTTYLPANGAGWYDFNNGSSYAGSQNVVTSVDKGNIPVFVRGGSILPLGPVKQYSAEPTDGTLDIYIFAGANADFTLYEDDGASFDYLDGKSSSISMHWDDKTRRLTIDKRKGEYPGMARTRPINIYLVDRDTTVPVLEMSPVSTVKYKGKKLTVRL